MNEIINKLFKKVKRWLRCVKHYIRCMRHGCVLKKDYVEMCELYGEVKSKLLQDSSIHHLVSQGIVDDYIKVSKLYSSKRMADRKRAGIAIHCLTTKLKEIQENL
jgi:hypothetical protein